jgi:hypothetical protein
MQERQQTRAVRRLATGSGRRRPGQRFTDSALGNKRYGTLEGNRRVRELIVVCSIPLLVPYIVVAVPGREWFSPEFHQRWVLFGGLLLLPMVVAWFLAGRMNHREWRIVRELESLARRPGWALSPDAPDLAEGWTLAPMGGARDTMVRPAARGVRDGIECGAFRFQGDAGVGGKVKAVALRVAYVKLPGVIPAFDLVPEGFDESLRRLLGGTDVDVESPQFNARWRVKATDARTAHAVLDPRMMEFLLGYPRKDLAVRIDNGYVLVWDGGTGADAPILDHLTLAWEFAQRVPRHVFAG